MLLTSLRGNKIPVNQRMPFGAASFSGIYKTSGFRSQFIHVFRMGHGQQMRGTHATAVFALMMYFLAPWNWPFGNLKRQAVRLNHRTVIFQPAIAQRVNIASKIPTLRCLGSKESHAIEKRCVIQHSVFIPQ